MHAILDLKSDWSVAKDDETLEKRLREASSGCFLVHDDWSELLVVANQDSLFATEHKGNHTLWHESLDVWSHKSVTRRTGFSSLSRFIDKDGSELELAQPRVASTNACTANHICCAQDLFLALTYESFVFALVV